MYSIKSRRAEAAKQQKALRSMDFSGWLLETLFGVVTDKPKKPSLTRASKWRRWKRKESRKAFKQQRMKK